ncbi:CARDB domain-containing protein [Herbidospora mongoliensis]|uniref:CARDB domain-containing protein n=1 Tax=Herbidospora mongoliensis TaxID=688067 RepID=UPI0014716F84|nr:CARDB domain-containing protein [Herbidospora mongoliensis]
MGGVAQAEPESRPDINVTGLVETTGATICPGDSPTVRATIHNSGQAPTGAFDYRWEDNDGVVETSTHTDIAAGGSGVVDLVLPDISKGTHIVKFIADPDREIRESEEGNNTRTVKLTVKECVPPGPHPDMAVTAMSILPGVPLCAGNSPTVRALIKNRGTVETGFFNIRWVDDAGTIFDGGHFSIPAGAVDSHDHIWHDITAGVHTVSFTADFDGGIPEDNENNNSRTFTFTVQECGGS